MDGPIDQRAMLTAVSEAFARGEAPRGEALLTRALDAGIPWDQVTAAAALGMARCYRGRSRSERVA